MAQVGAMRLSWNEIRARAARFSTDWSDARYSPRDLYAKNPPAFDDHLKALRQAAESFAADSRLAFLLGHQLWFDGQRDEAKALILKARAGGKVTPAETFELK